jgi:hypothetical protein
MFDFIKPDDGPDGQDGHIFIMKIQQGKTLQHKTIWDHVMRNRDVKICPLRGTALYLFRSFEFTQEEFDFSGKLELVQLQAHCFIWYIILLEKINVGAFFGTMLQHTCGELDVKTDKRSHFGPKYGDLYAKMQDVPISEIEHLGNWSQPQREEGYSPKLIMKALRVMGGHEETKGSYFLAHAAFKPPEEVQIQIFIFIDAALMQVNATNKKGWKCVMACGFS